MRPIRCLATAISMLLVAACAQPRMEPAAAPAPATPAATYWLADVSAIADADATGGRRVAIQRRLNALGIAWRSSPFEIAKEQGVNILADVAGADDAPLLLIGAHSDQVQEGEGATDNASGSATVLALAQRLKERPLANHRVAIAFWDLEEKGLLGAKAYVADGGAKPALYVNFDVFGWGDTIWMMTPDTTSPLVQASEAAVTTAGLKLSAGEQYPPTDHLAFIRAGWPAVSYSLVGGDEIPLILEAYAGKKLATVPKVMQVIHTRHDTLAQIDPNAATRGVDAVEDALRRWDAASAPAPAAAQASK
ncbi:MAG TPA: M28 family metallopeptidase [Lysobacter sp.]